MLSRPQVRELCYKLNRHSPVRKWLLSHEDGAPAGSPNVLLDLLAGPRTTGWRDSAVGYYALVDLELTQRQRETASHLTRLALEPEDSPSAFFDRLVLAFRYSLFCALPISFIVFLSEPYNPRSDFAGLLLTAYLLSTIGMFAMFSAVDRKRTLILLKAAVTAIAQVGGPECVPVLNYRLNHGMVRSESEEALLAVLTTVTEDWYGRLPHEANQTLFSLSRSASSDLALAALAALGNAGGGESANFVERLGRRAKSEAVRLRAEAILPILLARRQNELAAGVLLRPSAIAGTSDILLRPAYEAEPDDAVLLRASVGIEDAS